MRGREFLNEQQIENCLKAHYDLDIIEILALHRGADTNACVFKVDARAQSYFVKLRHGHYNEINLAIIELLAQAGIRQIISPIKTNQQQVMVSIGDFHLVVYPFIDAQDAFSHSLSDQQWILLGKALQQIHGLKVPTGMQARLRKENYSLKFRQSVCAFYEQFNALKITDEIAEKLFAFMRQEQKIILHLVKAAENLANIIPSSNPQYSLCHSDIHGGNVLVDGHDRIYIVDWDEPIMAPKERDLMFIGGGVGNVWNQPHEEALFYQGYGNTLVDKNILAYYRYERIIEDISEYVQQLLLSSSGGENREIMYQHFMDMFAPRGVVEIALRQ
ncbi:phosphotransferase [Candidatus Berkiella cookevillensis]|uniref:Phosphotransferase n=1 Tax=Candidatus Berkiella cookevillensis TaxID=437022 RepID=A0A0Q9YLV9_9GAMM|nr:phosphotransferase [Candidatus Berkiella cookevillensis]MCS5708698.1 phosphotransferase [Candidatus Berkiella cookevillensis]